jgi:hypothetical protein
MIGGGIVAMQMIVMLRTFWPENRNVQEGRLASGAWHLAHRRAQQL